MNSLSEVAFWCVVQVTLFSAATLIVGGLLSRHRPVAAALVAFSGLVLVIGLTAASFSPWPAWHRVWETASPSDSQSRGSDPIVTASQPATSDAMGSDISSAGRKLLPRAPLDDPSGELMSQPLLPPGRLSDEQDVSSARDSDFMQMLWNALPNPRAGTESLEPRRTNWPLIGLVAYAIGVGLMGARGVLGLWTVRAFRRQSRPIEDNQLDKLAADIRAGLNCNRPIEIRVLQQLDAPATIGWRRPMILLPRDWQAWNEAECRAVLAHEIAHICRNDFLSWCIAQAGVVIHFYHPFVHWLASRLRLQQELAADAAASLAVGGQREYVATLAAMALRRDGAPLPWPARGFLPTSNTFLRRIEMLRRSKPLFAGASRVRRVLCICCVTALAVFASGFRPMTIAEGTLASATTDIADRPSSPEPATPPVRPANANSGLTISQSGLSTTVQPAAVAATPSSGAGVHSLNQVVDLRYVPRDALMVIAVRPSALMKAQGARPLVEAIEKRIRFQRILGVPLDRIDQVTAVALTTVSSPARPVGQVAKIGGIVLRMVEPSDVPPAFKALASGQTVEYAGRSYFKHADFAGLLDGDRTIVLACDEPFLRRMLIAGPAGPGKAPWTMFTDPFTNVGPAVGQPEDWSFLAILQLQQLRTCRYATFGTSNAFFPLPLPTPALDSDLAMVAVRVRNGVDAWASFRARGFVQQGQSWQDLIDEGRVELSHRRDVLSRDASAAAAADLSAADTLDELLDSVRIHRAKNVTRLTASLDGEELQRLAPLIAQLGSDPGQGFSRNVRRTDDKNHLKQLALAMHNYHDVHNHFPAAAVMGPDGKTLHSWRVELLPFLDAGPLYQQYKMNEPWDSPANKKILAQMPEVFLDTHDDPKSTSSGYYVIVGPGSAFEGTKGIGISDIIDGTSNTLMIVEAKRNIPWTKPEDIPFDPAKPLPKLGGFVQGRFLAAMADGRVQSFETAKVKDQLKWLIQRNDRQPIDWNAIGE